jgi:hypothetical protein
MGYMGLGLQKWIYQAKPRKFFSRDRKNEGSDTADNAHFYADKSTHFPSRSAMDEAKTEYRRYQRRVIIGFFGVLALLCLFMIARYFFWLEN